MSSRTPEERLALFQNMADADPENELAHFSVGKVHFEMENFELAEASFRRTLELSPRHTLAQRFLGEALVQTGRRDEGVELLSTAMLLAHEKGEWKPRNEMQTLLESLGADVPALPVIEKADAPSDASPGADGTGGPDGNTVRCRRCSNVHPRLKEAPFPTDLGRQIHDTVCLPCWKEWIAVSIKVINEYRLNLMLPEAQETYDQHMREFLGL